MLDSKINDELIPNFLDFPDLSWNKIHPPTGCKFTQHLVTMYRAICSSALRDIDTKNWGAGKETRKLIRLYRCAAGTFKNFLIVPLKTVTSSSFTSSK
jgi:hypothetical protein